MRPYESPRTTIEGWARWAVAYVYPAEVPRQLLAAVRLDAHTRRHRTFASWICERDVCTPQVAGEAAALLRIGG